jgi:predicted amidohydrolase
VERNVARIVELAGARPEADLLCFPELCTTGYAFTGRDEALSVAEPVPDGPTVQALVAAAREHGTALVVGVDERDGDDLFNTAVVVGPDGYVGRYRKCHLFWNEKGIFTPGDRLAVFEVPLGPERVVVPLGVLICFDWAFPEAWRTLALRGAQVCCCPSNLVLRNLAQRAIPVHALVNRFFAVLANRVGTERELTFTGGSLVADPLGEVVASAGDDAEATAVVELDLARALEKLATPRNHVLDDRRPELYD